MAVGGVGRIAGKFIGHNKRTESRKHARQISRQAFSGLVMRPECVKLPKHQTDTCSVLELVQIETPQFARTVVTRLEWEQPPTVFFFDLKVWLAMTALRELPAAPKELREAFPGKFHLHLLWCIVRSYENTAKGTRMPCRVSYFWLGVELANQMGRPHEPYQPDTVGHYLTELRKAGWIYTYCLHYDCLSNRYKFQRKQEAKLFAKKKGVAPRVTQDDCGRIENNRKPCIFLNYAVLQKIPQNRIIYCKIAKTKGGVVTTARATQDDCGRIGNTTTNINYYVIYIGGVVVDWKSTKDEIIKLKEITQVPPAHMKGLLNMRGFFDLEEKPKKTPSVDFADAKRLHAALVEVGTARGQRFSQSKWSEELSKAKKKYPEYPEVFEWVLSKLPERNHFLRGMVHSASSFVKKFPRLKEHFERDKNRCTLEIPDDSYAGLIDECTPVINDAIPDLKTLPKDLEYSLWETFDFIACMIEALEEEEFPRGSLMESAVSSLINAIESPAKWLDIYIAHLENLTEWDKWSGRIARTKLSVRADTPAGQKFLFDVVDKIVSRNDVKLRRKLKALIKELLDGFEPP